MHTGDLGLNYPAAGALIFNYAALLALLTLAVLIGRHAYRASGSLQYALKWFVISLFFPIGPLVYYFRHVK